MNPIYANGDPQIAIRGVGKTFPTRVGGTVAALSGINLDIGAGEFISLVGQSGCGKTTLLNMMCGLIPTSTGVIRIRGEGVVSPRSDVGYMQQTAVLLPWRTLTGNVMLPYDIHRPSYERRAIEDRAAELLEIVGLQEFQDSYPRELSGGMQQRAALVRTLTYEPKILLMDEPFASLDEFNREALNTELLKLWEGSGITVVFVTHNVREAVFLSDKVVVMSPRPGRIANVVQVPIARPRHVDQMFTAEFTECAREIRSMLDPEDVG